MVLLLHSMSLLRCLFLLFVSDLRANTRKPQAWPRGLREAIKFNHPPAYCSRCWGRLGQELKLGSEARKYASKYFSWEYKSTVINQAYDELDGHKKDQ